ncbi:Gfo/Idh/MocA family protein [Jannaschia seohaensis]|uniref:Predicted dehydrogenase n=1 Tax=Jannaschia seohaensis TaxID=475081 RepID=A0A2Y9B083_9RHOB|nr:Gfo/Idh/MocA family oxidoreductase [Jannaschia seohaensis]PWJ15065.1 putative dehydrogenase [Jannaschia seohaensis]SSA49914.1 Predicted dehydrogenase [Jannaschia seohaensis]
MTDPIRWGVLGASDFARRSMAPAIHAASGHVLAALATRDAAKAAPFADLAPGLRVHESYDALLADPGIDAVYVPLPHTMHVEWGVKALEAGKHVLVEKPLAMTEAGIAPLIAARDATGLQAAEAYMIVHHPQWQFVRELIDDGVPGQLRHVEGVFTYNNSADPGNIRNTAAMGGGALPDIGVYTYGSTRWATRAEPEAITHADLDWEAGCDVVARVSARFPGFTAHWVNSMRMLPEQFMLFHGDAGIIRVTAPFNAAKFGEAVVEWRGRDFVTHRRTWPGLNQYVHQVEAFGAAIRGEAAFPWTLEDAAGTQRVIDMAYAAAGGRPPA